MAFALPGLPYVLPVGSVQDTVAHESLGEVGEFAFEGVPLVVAAVMEVGDAGVLWIPNGVNYLQKGYSIAKAV